MNTPHYQVAIIGSGPAGYTAAIYASRASLKTVVFEGIERGGQLMITTEVENYPGFPDGITGPELMENFRNQASRFGTELITKLVSKVILDERPFKLKSGEKEYTADSIIIATGATARFLDIPSETAFKGKGVSACATCDGFFFKDKEVIVVGGGDSAMEEALFLTKFATKVSIIHRRDVFKASKIMYKRAVDHPKIEIKSFYTIEEIYGNDDEGSVAGVKLNNLQTNTIEDFPVQGVFIAIGHDPNVSLFENYLELDNAKYIKTEPDSTKTNIEGVFAAGDIQDSIYRQAITAAGSGCMAAIETEHYIESIK